MPVDLDALKARLSEYDDTLPRCQGKVARTVNCAPDHLPSDDPTYPDHVLTTYSPCCRPEGHADECRNSRSILGWPGLDTLRALLEEVENLRAHRESCHANLLKGYETGKVEERKLIVAWLWQQSVATHDYEGNGDVASEVYASAARAIEQGASRKEKP